MKLQHYVCLRFPLRSSVLFEVILQPWYIDQQKGTQFLNFRKQLLLLLCHRFLSWSLVLFGGILQPWYIDQQRGTQFLDFRYLMLLLLYHRFLSWSLLLFGGIIQPWYIDQQIWKGRCGFLRKKEEDLHLEYVESVRFFSLRQKSI